MRAGRVGIAAAAATLALLAGCGAPSFPAAADRTSSGAVSRAAPPTGTTSGPGQGGTAAATLAMPTRPQVPNTAGPAATSTPRPAPGATPAPSWLGRKVLPRREDGYGVMGPTPKELDPRNIETVDVLPPPAGGRYRSTVSPVPADVLARSTWSAGCPVTLADLRYVTVSFVGFDGRAHTGELIVHRTAAAGMVRVFRRIFRARFPIERMVVTTVAERDMPPTGDDNTTGAFNCRSAAGSSHWSQHAYGLALDVNPFMNPYVKRDITLPELARTYRDRADVRPGMITSGDAVVRAFAAEGWTWGGRWKSLKDFMHFSRDGT